MRLGAFELLEPLARGGMAVVWRGHQPTLDLPVAIKILDAVHARDPWFVARFRREVQAVAALDHPGIVSVIDCGEVPAGIPGLPDGAPWLACELVDGGTLEGLDGSLPFERVRSVLAQVLDALAHAHAHGVIHRDVKPANLLRDRQGAVKLADFGIARVAAAPDSSEVKRSPSGTPVYMAPEQMSGDLREVGAWTDLYALGCVAFELIAGRPPFRGNNVLALVRAHVTEQPPPLPVRDDVPGWFDAWVRRLLEKRPEDRFQRADAALQALLDGTANDPPPPPLPADWRREADRQAQAPRGTGIGLVGLRPPPMLARDLEQDVLWDGFRHAAAGEGPRGAVLTGPPGSGRSRLADWLAARAARAGALVLRVDGAAERGPGEAVRAALTASLRVDGLTGDALGERLRARLPAADDDARRALAIAIEGGTPDERLTATRRLLALLAVDHPVLLLVDDAEKSASARSLARAILRAPLPEEARVYVLASASAAARESDAAAWDEIAGLSSLKSVDALPLRPLSNDAIRRVLLAVAPLLPRAAEDIARRAQGVPGFAVQIVADLVRRGALRATADGLTPKAGEASALPDDLFAYWRRRVEDAVATLPADAVVHLELLAALGASVDEAEWLQACGSAGLKVDGRVQHALLRSQLARSDGRRWTLVHGLLRESLLRTSREAGRAPRVHRACADAIAQRHREGHPQRAPRVGHHLLLAGQAEAALPHLLSAAERLLSDGDRTPVPGLLAEADLAVAAASLPREDSRRGELRLLHATLLRDTDHVGEATAVAEALAREAEAILSDEAEVDGAEARVRFVGGRARWRHVRGDALRAIAIARREAGELESAEAILSNAHALLSSIDDDSALGRCYATWAWLARYRADWSRAEALFTEAHARFLAAGDVAGAASALEGIGDVLRRIGELDRAEATFRQAIDLARRTGALRSLAKCLQSLAYVALPRGQIDTARKLLEESHALYARLGNPSAVAQVLVGLGEVERAQGDLSRAEALYRRSLEMFERGGSGWAFLPRANLGIVLLERGDWEGAETVLLAARGEVLRHGRKGYQVAIDGLRLVRLAATGRGAELDADIDAVRRGLAELGSFEKDLAWAFERAGRLLLERGDGKRARALFSMAEAQCEGLQDAVGLRRVRDAARAIG